MASGGDLSLTALCLWYYWLIFLLPAPGGSNSGGSGGSGGSGTRLGPACPLCPVSLEAHCPVNYENRTITCSVDLSSCDSARRCTAEPDEEDKSCVVHFNLNNAGRWTFAAGCFPETRKKRSCELKPSYRVVMSFPPKEGLICSCQECALDSPHTYIHPYPLQPSDTVPTLSPTPPSSSLAPSVISHGGPSAVQTGYVIVGVALGALLVLVVIASVSVAVIYSWRRAKHRPHQSSRSRNQRGVPTIPVDDEPPFQLGNLVSRGRYGYVYRTEYEGELVAVKVFSHQNRLSWENERTLFGMQSTKHRNVIDYIVGGMWGSGCQLQMFIVTPFFPLGSLNRFLGRNTVSWEQACRVIHSVSSGLAHLHAETYTCSSEVPVEKYAVAHRDIKSANVLVRGENGDCVISDLGFAMILDPARDEKDMANAGQVGTYRYMAPEVLDARISLQDIQAFKQIDIYSLGLVMWEVIWRCNVQQEESPREYLMAYEDSVGARPGIDTMRDLVCTQKTRPRILPAWRNHPGLGSLVVTIEECWDEDPEARLSASNIILRLKELLDGGPSSLASDHTPSHSFPHPPVVPGNSEGFRVSEALESTTDTIGTTDSRPPPYDSRWSYAAPPTPAGPGGEDEEDGSGEASTSVTMGLNFEETTV